MRNETTYIKHQAMSRGGQIAKFIFHEVEKILKAGITTNTINSRIHTIMDQSHVLPAFLNYPNSVSSHPSFPAASCISVNEEIVHGIPSKRVIKTNDLISVDIGICQDDYIVDCCRSYVVDATDKDIIDLNYWTKRALDAALREMRAGVNWNEIAGIIQGYASRNGYGIIRELCGHGIGKSLHEGHKYFNYQKEGQNIILNEGDTLCVEPMFCLGSPEVTLLDDKWTISTKDGKPAAHHEATVIITKDGCEILSE